MRVNKMSKMAEFDYEQSKQFDGTEGYSVDEIDQEMRQNCELSRAEYMGTIVLKKVRVELGLNQQQMADVLGYTRQDIISGIENGTRTMSGVAMRCLEYLIEIEKLKFVLKEKQSTL